MRSPAWDGRNGALTIADVAKRQGNGPTFASFCEEAEPASPMLRAGFAISASVDHIVTDLQANWLIAAGTGWC
jgi:hypothetical protein